jgi:hypothetical protein
MRFGKMIITTVAVCVIGCGGKTENETRSSETQNSESNVESVLSDSERAYRVIHRHVAPGDGKDIYVRLNQTENEETLRSIALEIKSDYSDEHLFSSIRYYLPGTRFSEDAWATAVFDPDLKITISDSADDEKPVYSIINNNITPGIKRSVDIRLNERISEEELRQIALAIHSSDPNYPRTFILYYLPGMELGSGAWATTHFNPNLEVRILGLTAETEARLTTDTENGQRNVLGRWLDDRPYASNRITIVQEGKKFVVETLFKDGSKLTQELWETASRQGRRFNIVGTYDYLVIDAQGNLRLEDNDGLIAIARKIN